MDISDKEDLIFSLDIGTRKVIGIIAEKKGDKLEIIDAELLEHTSRNMLDGQIHNINEVAKIVNIIKQRLEERLKIKLQKVGVAVAGRALKTLQVRKERSISLNEEITEDDVRNLELEAVSGALSDASSNFGKGDYYCVGYSVVYHELDGAVIGELTGHYGQNMAVEVIATFLPRVVLNSMLSVLHRAGLEVRNLTLEPIAAINVIIPKDIRRLNLLLLDIGAGTSDIALTKNGMVFAYGMVPEAGDEITEVICEKYILDFNTAEKIKRSLLIQPKIKFKDILGREHELESGKILEEIRPRVKELASAISNCVLELNQKIPHAVILVGGGSLTPVLDKELAHSFPLDISNIGVRLPEMIDGITDLTGKLKTPDMVTPIGITLMTADCCGLKFVEIFVNDNRVQVLDMQQEMDVLSALVASGINHQELYGKIGQAICVEINGQFKVIKGKMGKPSQVKVNGKKADLNTKIKNKDKITFKKAVDGEDAKAKISDVLEASDLNITLNGREIKIKSRILMNGFPAALDAELVDRANIECGNFVEARELLENAGIEISGLEEREVVIRVNKEPRVLSQTNFTLLVNGQRASLNTKIYEGSIVEFMKDKPAFYRIKDVVELPASGKTLRVLLNGQEYFVEGSQGKIFMNGQPVNAEEFLIDRAEITTHPGDSIAPTVSHMLKYLLFDPQEQKGKTLKITVNGEPGGFTTKLSEGVKVYIGFVDRSSV